MSCNAMLYQLSQGPEWDKYQLGFIYIWEDIQLKSTDQAKMHFSELECAMQNIRSGLTWLA